MVCRDANTRQAYKVNPLVVSTPEETSLYAIGKREFVLRASLATCLRHHLRRYEGNKANSRSSLPFACASYV